MKLHDFYVTWSYYGERIMQLWVVYYVILRYLSRGHLGYIFLLFWYFPVLPRGSTFPYVTRKRKRNKK